VRGVTFFQRIKTPFTEGSNDEQARLQPRMRQIGEMLQERREDLGLDLDEIGAMLRIKPAYLAAIEQGRSHDLPGPTYAIGFVRAYADFLGLDSDAVLVRFKAEGSGLTARPDLARRTQPARRGAGSSCSDRGAVRLWHLVLPVDRSSRPAGARCRGAVDVGSFAFARNCCIKRR
jgi:transcriptional regulator with XRE-family HTH domain